MVEKMVQVEVNRQEIEPYLPPVFKMLRDLEKEELIQRFVSVEFNRFLNYYRHSGDLNAQAADRRGPKAQTQRPPGRPMQRLFINVGRMDNIREGAIVRLVCEQAGIGSDRIGQIQLKRDYTLFDVDKEVVAKVVKSLKGARLDRRKVDIRFADSAKPGAKKKES